MPRKKLSTKEIEEFNDVISKQAVHFPSLHTVKYTPTYTTSASPAVNIVNISVPVEDLEQCDLYHIRESFESAMDSLYPPFEPEIVHAVDKDYFLPALKVLVYQDDKYFSPQQQAWWKDMELEAGCAPSPWNFGAPITKALPNGQIEVTFDTPTPHAAPKEDCDCGIYGSVNLEEVHTYLMEGVPVQMQRQVNQLQGHWIASYGTLDGEPVEPVIRRKLCIIEPSPGAKVILCRKGWKASGAFISEIVGETISPEEASNLLSIAWNRKIDIRRLHENY